MARIGAANREAERRIMEALQVRLSARFQRSMARAIATEYRNAAQAVERQEPWSLEGGRTGRILLSGWESAASTFGQRMVDALGKSGRRVITKADWRDLFGRAFADFAQQWLATKITQIDSTTEEQIRALIEAGLAEGLSVEQIAKTIRRDALPTSRLRAHVIARTETHFAAGWANETAAQESDVVLLKEWCAAGDSRTRDTHMDADGQRVAQGASFDVGGYSLAYPGDASGPAVEVVSCRCQALYLTED